MSEPASNQTRLHAAKAIARHRKQQEQKAFVQMVTDTPNRAQRRVVTPTATTSPPPAETHT